jgi:hypothetical protein
MGSRATEDALSTDAIAWIERIAALTTKPEASVPVDLLADSSRRAAQYLSMARLLVHGGCPRHHPGAGREGLQHAAASCALEPEAGAGAERACLLAGVLGAAGDDGPSGGDAGPVPPGDVPRAYVAALVEAIPAIYYCRKLQHPYGRCWFGAEGSRGGCGHVLAIAHTVRLTSD